MEDSHLGYMTGEFWISSMYKEVHHRYDLKKKKTTVIIMALLAF